MTPAPDLQFRPYQPQDAAAFRQLNEQWIVKYFALEEQDRIILNNPENYVLKPGGHIFFAIAHHHPIGCCALIPVKPGVYELAKMAVDEEYRGRGIGRRLLEYTIAQARSLGARSLCLESHTVLANAIHLYKTLGFRRLPPESVEPSLYARSDIHMALDL